MPSKKTTTVAIKSPSEEKQIDIYLKEAHSLKIETPEGMRSATVFLSNLNKANDKVTAEKEKVTKPLNEALRAERNRWKPVETKLAEAIALVRGVMTKYQTESVKKQKEEEAKIAARVGEGKGHLTAETAVRKMEEIEAPEEVVATEAGSVQFRSVMKFEVMDITMLPKEFLLPNEVKIRENMKQGNTIPGVRYYEEQVPYNSR